MAKITVLSDEYENKADAYYRSRSQTTRRARRRKGDGSGGPALSGYGCVYLFTDQNYAGHIILLLKAFADDLCDQHLAGVLRIFIYNGQQTLRFYPVRFRIRKAKGILLFLPSPNILGVTENKVGTVQDHRMASYLFRLIFLIVRGQQEPPGYHRTSNKQEAQAYRCDLLGIADRWLSLADHGIAHGACYVRRVCFACGGICIGRLYGRCGCDGVGLCSRRLRFCWRNHAGVMSQIHKRKYRMLTGYLSIENAHRKAERTATWTVPG